MKKNKSVVRNKGETGNRFSYFYHGLATEIFTLKNGKYIINHDVNP
jgi:hypothetical protein